MTEQITLEEALELVSFRRNSNGDWYVETVKGCVRGHVHGNVRGIVCGTIKGRRWEFIQTPKEKLQRLVKEGADKEQILKAVNQLEDN